MSLAVTSDRLVRERGKLIRLGVLGRAHKEIGDALVIRDVAVRRARSGRHVLSFPARRLRGGRHRAIAHPLRRSQHVEIEREVISALQRQGRLA